MITLFNYLLIFNVFAGGFVLFTSPFEFYAGYIFLLIFLIGYVIRYHRISINLNFLVLLVVLSIASIFNIFAGNNTGVLFLKQVVGILLNGLAYYLLVKVNQYDVQKLFKVYLQIALIVALIGIFQELSFLVGFQPGYDYSWIIKKWQYMPATGGMLRVNSIFAEPSHLAISMAPALFVALAALLKSHVFYLDKKASIAIVVCFILTFSIVAYVAIFISVFFLYFNVRKIKHIFLVALLIAISGCVAYYMIPEIRMRVGDAIGIATGSRQLTESHLSIYALVSNAFVAAQSFLGSMLFGSGLGSHPVSYDAFMNSHLAGTLWGQGYVGVNRSDAGSLLLRLISETGLFGVIAVFYFMFRFRITNEQNKDLWVLSSAIFVIFLMQLLRQGHYFYNGFFFFVWLYYFAYKMWHAASSSGFLGKK